MVPQKVLRRPKTLIKPFEAPQRSVNNNNNNNNNNNGKQWQNKFEQENI